MPVHVLYETPISTQQGKAMEVSRLGRTVPGEEIKSAITLCFRLLQYKSLTPEQALAIEKFLAGKDV